MATLTLWASQGDGMDDDPQGVMHVSVILRGQRLVAETVWSDDEWPERELIDVMGRT